MKNALLIIILFLSTAAFGEDRIECELNQYDLSVKKVTKHFLKTEKNFPKELIWQNTDLFVHVDLFGKDTISSKITFKQASASSIAKINPKLAPFVSKTTTSLSYGDRYAFNLYCSRTEAIRKIEL